MPTRDRTPDLTAAPVTRRLLTGCLLLVLPVLTTCRIDDLLNPRTVVFRLLVQPDTLRLRSLGEVGPLEASGLDARGHAITPATVWSSDEPAVATVDAQGVVTAQANGETWVRGRADAGADSVRVVVRQAARQVIVTPPTAMLGTVGASGTLRAVVRDSLGSPMSGATVLWANQAPDTVRIVAAGSDSAVVEAVREGRADIQATSDAGGGGATGASRVEVRYVLATLALSPRQPKLSTVGDTLRFTASGTDANGAPVANARVRWTSSDPARLAIDSATGLATARDSGTALMRAERDGLADTTTAQVLPPVLAAETAVFADSARFGSSDTRSASRTVTNAGTLTLGVGARRASGSPWLTVTPDTLTLAPSASAPIQLTTSAAGLAEGTYRDTVVLESRGAAGSPKRIPVIFRSVCPAAGIAPDTVLTGTFAPGDCRSARRAGSFADLYRFTGGAGDTIRLSLTAPQPDFDTYVYVLDAAGAVIAQNDDCPGGNSRNSCLAGVELTAAGSYTIEATTFAPGAAFSYTLALSRPLAPAAPTGLAQLRPDNTPIPANGTTNNTTVRFQATATDANARDSLRLQVELRPFGTAFTGTPTHQGPTAPNAMGDVTLSATATSVATGDHHWRARVADQTGRAGPWTEFGPGDPDFSVSVTSPILTVTPDAVLDSALQGATTPRQQALEIGNTGTGSFAWTATRASTWLGVTPATGSGNPPAAVTLALDPTGLAAGIYHDTVVVTAPGALGSPDSTLVRFVIQRPVLRVLPDSVRRETQSGSGATFDDTLRITNTGTGPLTWSAVKLGAGTWLTLAKTSGGAPDVLPLTIASAGRAAGIHSDIVVVTAAGGGGSPDTILVRLVVNPAPPTAPGQLKSDEATSIALDGTTDENTVKFRGTIGETGAAGQVRLDIEVVLAGDAFTGTPTASSSFGAQNRSAVATVSNLADDAGYHWRARTTDDGGRSSAWVSFGGNAETDADFRVGVPQPPNVPSDSAQLKNDATAPIPVGAATDQNAVVFRATVTDPDPGDLVKLEVEVRPIDSSFTNQATVSSILVPRGSPVSVSVSGLADDKSFHWQYRGVDQGSRASAWTAFGGNLESQADFRVAVPQDPLAPTGQGQFKSDGTTPIGPGATTDERTVALQATLNDPDPGDQLRLEIELRRIDSAFTGTATHSSGQVSVGAPATVTAGGLADDTAYHWRYRTVDQTGRPSGWTDFGGSPAVDFRLTVPDAPNVGGLGQFQSNGTTPIPVGDRASLLTVILKGTVTDPDAGDVLRLEVEVKTVGTAFNEQNLLAATGLSNNAEGSVSQTVLILTDYHWRARACDQTNRCSGWLSFPDPPDPPNLETEADFRGPLISSSSRAPAHGDRQGIL